MLERRLADEAAAFDREMFLRRRQRVGTRDFFHRHARDRLLVRDDIMRIGAGAEQVTVEAHLFTDRPGVFATVA